MINFMKHRTIYFTLSLIVIIPGIFSLFKYGLNPSIDFTGGTLIEITNYPDRPILEQIFQDQNLEIISLQTSESSLIIRTSFTSLDQQASIGENLEIQSLQAIGPTMGKELLRKTITGVILATLGILLYVAWRFNDKKFGVCAVLAMLHDSLIILGCFSILGHFQGIRVDTLFVTALLTILSFSVHDTIVVYDRIREISSRFPKMSFIDVVNKAVTETLSRSINNSMTIIFMLLAVYLLGGETLKQFILALLIGTIAGTYSSTFTAAPLLIVWDKLLLKKKS